MTEMLVMRHANGDLFTEALGGQPRIPVWSSRAAVSRYRECKPELLIDLPARLDDSLIKRIASGIGRERGARLSFSYQRTRRTLGRLIFLDELLLTRNVVSPPATVEV
jgi:hypothetical protein